MAPLEQVALEHCERCGCRESHLGGDHKLHVPKPLQILPPQQSVLTMRGPPSLLQHLPFSDTPLQHTVVGVTVVPLLEQQRTWQMPLQHPLVGLQLVPSGRHIGVVVDVEVVLVEVVVVLSPHAPRRSPWRRWPSRATRTRLHNHHPEHLLSRTPRHAGLRRRCDGSSTIVRATSLGLQHGCSTRPGTDHKYRPACGHRGIRAYQGVKPRPSPRLFLAHLTGLPLVGAWVEDSDSPAMPKKR